MKWIVALVALSTTAIVSVGCGGGGGGGGGSSSGSGGGGSDTFSGKVVDQSNTAIAGDKVLFDGNSSYSSTTSSSGGFSISVPKSAVTGADYLTVQDTSGVQIATYSLPSGSQGQTGITIQIGPPPPPSSLGTTR